MNLLFLSLILSIHGTSGVKADNITIEVKDRNVSVFIKNIEEKQMRDLIEDLLFAIRDRKIEEVPTKEHVGS